MLKVFLVSIIFLQLNYNQKQSLGEFWTRSCFPTRINRNLISETKTANIVKSKDHKVVKNMGTIWTTHQWKVADLFVLGLCLQHIPQAKRSKAKLLNLSLQQKKIHRNITLCFCYSGTKGHNTPLKYGCSIDQEPRRLVLLTLSQKESHKIIRILGC